MIRNQLRIPDSVEKIVRYLALLSSRTVTWGPRARVVNPIPTSKVLIGPSIWRVMECPHQCHACCLEFTVDFLPQVESQIIPKEFWRYATPREVIVNGKKFEVATHNQENTEKCPFLQSWGCTLYPNAPLSCISAPQIQVVQYSTTGAVYIRKGPFGRAWRWQETPQCIFRPPQTQEDLQGCLQKEVSLWRRFYSWAEYLQIPTCIPEIIRVYEQGRPTSDAIEVWRREG